MARGVVVKPGELSLLNEIRDTYTLPVFVKPNNNGSSYGITKVQDWLKLEPALEEGFHYDHEILVEEGITGTEVTCGGVPTSGRNCCTATLRGACRNT